MHSDVNEEGQMKEGVEPPLPRSPPSLGRDKVNSGITVRPDAGMLIAVDRSSKQCVLLSQVECHSE